MKKRRTSAKSRKRQSSGRREVEIRETTRITTEPKLEIRKPATLSQALTEPAVAVVKPETKARVVRRVTRRVA
jgi:hypothetical protein